MWMFILNLVVSEQYMASLYIVSLTFKMNGRRVTNTNFMRKKKGTRLELVNKNVLINVSKSVFTPQLSYQPSLRVQPESLHTVFYFSFVFTLEDPNRVMNDLLMLDYWSKKEKSRELVMKCHEDHQSAVYLLHCNLRELNPCSVVIRYAFELAECYYSNLNKMSACASKTSLSLSQLWLKVCLWTDLAHCVIKLCYTCCKYARMNAVTLSRPQRLWCKVSIDLKCQVVLEFILERFINKPLGGLGC